MGDLVLKFKVMDGHVLLNQKKLLSTGKRVNVQKTLLY